jgi:hypothetical protein
MAGWTKPKVCDKACFESTPRREHQAGQNPLVLFVPFVAKQNAVLIGVNPRLNFPPRSQFYFWYW